MKLPGSAGVSPAGSAKLWRASTAGGTPALPGVSFCLLLSAFCLFAARCATQPKPNMLDLKIINGRIIDGTGAPWYRGDVGVRGDTIVSIGDLSNVAAANTIDAHDNVVSPGFIDLLGQSQYSVFQDPHLEAKVRQGITTEVTGEGSAPGPLSQRQIDAANPANRPKWHTLGEWFSLLEKNGTA